MIALLQDPSVGNMITFLLEQYGITGVLFAFLLWLILKQNKKYEGRIANLEKQKDEQQKQHIEAHKEMIHEYVELVRNKTKILAELTGALNAIKGTLDRMEQRRQ